MRQVSIGLALGLSLAGAVALLWEKAAAAQPKVPESRTEITLSYAPVVKEVAPAVVNIYAKRVVQTRGARSPLFDDPFFKRFFGDNLRGFGAPRERVQNSLGSGVIVGADGTVVTNNHVIEKASEITVVLADRREFAAELILADERTDLAVLRLKKVDEKLPALSFGDSEALEVGDLVLAVGNPFGVGQTVTSGIVSALARTQVGVSDYQFFIQTDAAINPGNSGGALVAMDGSLIGINTAIYSRGGGSVGIGFAIPAAMVQTVVATAIKGEELVRPWLGAAGQPVTAEIAEGLGLDRPGGVLVNDIYPGGPADKAGLRVGDVVQAVGKYEIFDGQGLRYRLAATQGKTATLTLWRNGKQEKLNVALLPPPEKPARNETEIEGRNPFGGATVANLSPAYADELGLDSMAQGVMVVKMSRRSYAARVGLRPGDIIAAVDGQAIDRVKELLGVIKSHKGDWTVTVDRGGKLATIRVGGE
ncbi:MAG: DegQ family serine endoprotease [Alphaproteobacteria bacterium]